MGSCSDQPGKKNSADNKLKTGGALTALEASEQAKGGAHYEGTFSNGYKGSKISFNISEDGTKLENLTFDGHWQCNGKLEQTKVGPEKAYSIENGKVDGHITEPEGGGSTAWRFELTATFDGSKAEGTFRVNINNLGCDTYKLNWTAERN